MQQARRYKAFISYSHDDERSARWLQHALERYKIPKTLRKAHPEMPARLFPIFRDRDELASSTDLSESIQRVMADSEAMIVVCSPTSARSQWVNEEVRRFREMRGDERIFCLLVGGSPKVDAADCAFPPALLRSDEGKPAREPLAADVTPGGDGERNAMLKIAAALLGVGIDELKRRDAQRRARLWAKVAAGSLAVAVVTIGLAIAAVIARQESEIRRHQGEKLIGFMLGDLRSKLEPIGKLDVLDAVGDQAMSYFAALGTRGTAQEMLDRAKALRQIGDVRFHQGHLERALAAFQQSLGEALALHEARPDNNEYLFELGQSEFWVGYAAWQRNDLEQAHASMEKYMRYSQELSDRAPDNAAYRMELAYAHNNLGSVAKAQGHAEEALREFRLAAEISETELKSKPGDAGAISDLADIWSWISSTLQDLGRLQESEQAAAKAADLIRSVHEQGKDSRASARYADYLVLLADTQLRLGLVAKATAQIESARAIYKGLLASDPSNAFWHQNALVADFYLAAVSAPEKWTPQTRQLLDATAAGLRTLADKDPTNKSILGRIAAVDRLQALGALALGDAASALASARRAHEVVQKLIAGKSVPAESRVIAAQVEETLGAATLANGDRGAAERIWSQALDGLGKEPGGNLAVTAIRKQLAADLGDSELAAQLSQQLAKAGFDDPRFEPHGGERL
ncbi:MAG TPA: TIR domain-containing protein [Rudaea sp.]|nr:TIR domain-containing protein [Rudaea sp.]